MHASHRLTLLARLGFASRGLVYILVGWFALHAARTGGQPADNQAALASLVDEPLGRGLLLVIGLGLLGYAVWRLLEAALDPEKRGRSTKGKFERAGYALSGVTHLILAVYAVRLAMHDAVAGGTAPGDSSARDWSAWLMAQPGGTLLLSLVGGVLFIVAGAQATKSGKAGFMRELEGDAPVPDYLRIAGRIGYGARAVVFALIGWFFIRAALHANPEEAGGMGQALRALQGQDYGPVLLGLVAVGLFLFGLFSLVEARFRRLKVVAPTSGIG
ncbi:DUF1206 domain-containing protein [Sphingomonas sp. LaA6.9]|uniref:DUF1206 domain-containing protein n=1 Tax=Sphingomonas sp. LaA6.9 TaxID=2919914 RepID=UPI001F5020A9|nr:DUF1206 domain-containing protein [Sphingomonas sp. LaA6.9]MCJ8159643.1 DUF1206 domain-containing protein [Sphingomonas sp. LaA6.9]